MSPGEIRNCFCGNVIGNGEGIYCSAGTSYCVTCRPLTTHPLPLVNARDWYRDLPLDTRCYLPLATPLKRD